jgi:signal peptidase I
MVIIMSGQARLSKLSVLGLTLGILGFPVFVFIPPGIVLSIAALYRIKRSHGLLKGRPVAIAGITIGILALLFAVSVIVLQEKHYGSFKVPTSSMWPTIKAKTTISADLEAYKKARPARGDIIVYEIIDKGRRRVLCKRVIGLPGEKIEIRAGRIFINGLACDIPGMPDGIVYANGGDFGKEGQPVAIPVGFYYVLGDNSSESFDSRQHGPVDTRDIKGKYLFTHAGFLK